MTVVTALPIFVASTYYRDHEEFQLWGGYFTPLAQKLFITISDFAQLIFTKCIKDTWLKYLAPYTYTVMSKKALLTV